ncbi:MAG: DUF1566 domain-containing protein [Desulfonatronovibrio sp.]
MAINSQLTGGRNMRRFFKTTTVALAFMLCLTGMVMSGTAFAERCVDNGDGTVTDNITGLMWEKATAGRMDWDAAMSYASGLTLGEYSDWKLPNGNELLGLNNSPCKNMMEVVLNWYWSSTTYSDSPDRAWLVGLYDGDVNASFKSSSYYVRAVRGAQ